SRWSSRFSVWVTISIFFLMSGLTSDAGRLTQKTLFPHPRLTVGAKVPGQYSQPKGYSDLLGVGRRASDVRPKKENTAVPAAVIPRVHRSRARRRRAPRRFADPR